MQRRTLVVAFVVTPFLGFRDAIARDVGDRPLRDRLNGAIELGVPVPVSTSWRLLEVDVPVRIRPVGVRGTIHRLAFKDMRLNGIRFEVEPNESAFRLPERYPLDLPNPLRLRLTYREVAPGIIREAFLPDSRLRLTGAARIDGTFRRWIFSARRTVDLPIDVERENPLAEYHPLKYALEKYDEWNESDSLWPF